MVYLDVEVFMDTPAKRIQVLMAEVGINQKELAERINRSTPLISGYLNGGLEIKEAFLLRLEKYLGWSSTWIQTGRGGKYINSETPTLIHEPPGRPMFESNAVPLDLVDETDSTKTEAGVEFWDLTDGTVLATIPYVDEYAYASYPSGWKDPEYIESLPKRSIVLPKRDKGRYRSFAVRGSSMDDGSPKAICDGDVATGRFLEPDNWFNRIFIRLNKDYIIVHADGVIVKRIARHDLKEGTIYCTSFNPDKDSYPDFTLSLNEIYEIYYLVKVEREWN